MEGYLEAVILASAYTIIFAISVVGNILTLLSVVIDKRLQTVPNVYVVNLAALDLVISVMTVISPLYQLAVQEVFPYCLGVGFVTVYSISCSRVLLCFIAINRYILIVKGKHVYMKWYRRPKVVISVVVSYVIPLVVLLPGLLGIFSGFTYNFNTSSCFFEADSRETYWYVTGFMEIMFFMPALFLTAILYLLIVKKFRQVTQNVKVAPLDDATNSTKPGAISSPSNPSLASKKKKLERKNTTNLLTRKEQRAIAHMIAVFVVFIVCWSPLCFLIIIDYWFKAPRMMQTIFMLLGASNSALNVFIYALMNSQFRKAYKKLLTCRCKEKDTI